MHLSGRGALSLLRHGRAAVVGAAYVPAQRRRSTQMQDSHLTATAGTYLEEMFESWQRDPKSVHSSWDAYFRGAAYSAPPSIGMTKPNEGAGTWQGLQTVQTLEKRGLP